MQPTELCRICGGTGLFLPIFDPECKYFDDIESCLSVRVKRNDTLSQIVCHKCVGTLSWCKDFVGKVNHVKKSRFEPSSKLCFSCRTADGPLFPLPKPSAEKLQNFFSLNTQKAKCLKICHECQFALDCISDLREKANTAQQLSRRGQHLQFQVLRKSPSVDDLLSSLKNREVEVDIGSRSNRTTKGPKPPSNPVGGEVTSRSKQQNGISNSKTLDDNKTRRKTGTKYSGDSDAELSVILVKLDKQKSIVKSEEKNNKVNSRSSESKTTKKKEVRISRSKGQENSDSDKDTAENSSGGEISPINRTSVTRADKRRRNEDKSQKAVESVSNTLHSAGSIRSRRQSREEKTLNNSVGSQSSKNNDISSKEVEAPGTKKLQVSKGIRRKPSLDSTPKSKRQRLSKPDESEEKSNGNLSDDSDVALSAYADASRSLRGKKTVPDSKVTPTKKLSRKSTEDNIPAQKRPEVKVVTVGNSRKLSSKPSPAKKVGASPRKVRFVQETVAKASKRKLATNGMPEGNSGKTRKKEAKTISDPEIEPQLGRNVVKKVKGVPGNPYTCGVCSKDFQSTALGKDHELQHDSRYNNFAVKLCRVDLTKSTFGQGSKDTCEDEQDDADLFPLNISSKPEQSTNVVDFDSILKDETKNRSGTSPDTKNSGTKEGTNDEKTTGNAESEPKDPEPEDSRLADFTVEPDVMVESEDTEVDKGEEKDEGKEKGREKERCEEPTVNTESDDSKPKESETQDLESKEENEKVENSGQQDSEPEKVESSESKESEEKPPESEEKPSESEELPESEEKPSESHENPSESEEKPSESEEKSLESEEKLNESEEKPNESEEKSNESEEKSNESEEKSNESEEKSNESEDKLNESEGKLNESEDKVNESEEKSVEGLSSDVPPREKNSPTSELIAVLEDGSSEAVPAEAESGKGSEDNGPKNSEPTLSTNIGVVDGEDEDEDEEENRSSSPVLGRKASSPVKSAGEPGSRGSKPDLVSGDKDASKDGSKNGSVESASNGGASSPPVKSGDA